MDYNRISVRGEDKLINDTMLTGIDSKKSIFMVLKSLIRYPRLGGKIGELEPNVYFGFTDHPLDINGTAMTLPFTFFTKNKGRKTRSVLWIELKERRGNSLIFHARGYNVYKVVNMNTMNRHEYLVDGKTRCDELTLQIDFLREDVYRLRLAPGKSVPGNSTPMIYKDIGDPDLKIVVDETEDKYTVSTCKLRLEIYKKKFRIEIFDADGNLITESGGQTKNEFPTPFDSFPLGFIRDKTANRDYAFESFVLYPGEAVYGLGERFGPVNKVGQTCGFWNFEGLGNTSGRTYKNIPFFMSTQGYGVYINESRPIAFWTGTRETCKNQFAVEGDLLDYFFLYGPFFKSILNSYTELTGKPHVPPKWSFGTWMSRISYFSQEQVMAVARKLREMKFPADVIHIDTGWFEKDWRCDWKFDPGRFPDPVRMFEEAGDMGFRICLWQIPYVLDETEVYRDAKKKKVIAKNNGPFAFLYMFPAHAIDFSNPEGVRWYQKMIKNLLDMGASTIKTDFGEQIEPHMQFMKYDGRQMHNLFPLLYQKAAFEAIQEANGEKEGVIWARSAYAGSQRYPLHWSGDNASNYENLLSSLRGGLSLGLCGFTCWSQDTGGFVGVPSEDLYIRWTQLSIFQSHLRFHGNPPQYKEPWNFGPETQNIIRDYLNLRYRLIPYLFTETQVAAVGGLPVLRHLVIDYQDDPNVYNIEDQFMCGRNILVAPILTKNSSRKIYIPQGAWVDYWTGERITGSRWIEREAEIRAIPFYIRGGTILPLAKLVQSTGALSYDDMDLIVCPDDNGDSAYEIREDGRTVSINAKIEGSRCTVEISAEISRVNVEVRGSENNPDVTIKFAKER